LDGVEARRQSRVGRRVGRAQEEVGEEKRRRRRRRKEEAKEADYGVKERETGEGERGSAGVQAARRGISGTPGVLLRVRAWADATI